MGGTFDPPHLAHLVLAEAAYHQLGVSSVEFIPTGNPWWKSLQTPSAAHHRLEMVKRATAGIPYWTVNECEVRRDGPSYMADTLQAFDSGDEIYLVLGADAAMEIRAWMRWRQVVERVRLVVAARPGTDLQQVEQAVGHSPIWLEIPRLDISSEQIRRQCGAGRSIRFLVPEPVLEYIRENRLYAYGDGV